MRGGDAELNEACAGAGKVSVACGARRFAGVPKDERHAAACSLSDAELDEAATEAGLFNAACCSLQYRDMPVGQRHDAVRALSHADLVKAAHGPRKPYLHGGLDAQAIAGAVARNKAATAEAADSFLVCVVSIYLHMAV